MVTSSLMALADVGLDSETCAMLGARRVPAHCSNRTQSRASDWASAAKDSTPWPLSFMQFNVPASC